MERSKREALFLSIFRNDSGTFLNLRYQDIMNLSQILENNMNLDILNIHKNCNVYAID